MRSKQMYVKENEVKLGTTYTVRTCFGRLINGIFACRTQLVWATTRDSRHRPKAQLLDKPQTFIDAMEDDIIVDS